MNGKLQMLKDVVLQTEKGSRTYSYGYRDGYFKALDDVEQIVNDIEQQFVNGGEAKPKKFQDDDIGVSVDAPVLPEPCIKGMDRKTVKDVMQKFNEEADEWKEAVIDFADLNESLEHVKKYLDGMDDADGIKFRIAEEAADVATVLASLQEAAGIDVDMRSAAQQRVNERNKERGRW